MRTANPALGSSTFKDLVRSGQRGDQMTIQGTANKAAMLLVLLLTTALWTWSRFFAAQSLAAVQPWMLLGMFGGLGTAIVLVFKKTWAPLLAPAYALLEGLFLGGLSAIFELRFPGIVIQAVALTFGTFAALLLAYKSVLIPVTQNLRLGIAAATGGIFLVYLATMVLGLFGIQVPMIHDSGPVGIGFSLVVVVIAALNLVLDFDFIEQGADRGLPKYLEWYAAFGLLVTLVWLYIEFLRLLAKTRGRN